jgi:hypothetical protein
MKRGMGQGGLTHGVRRDAQYKDNGNSTSRLENIVSTTQHLHYEEIIAGMGYSTNRKHQTQNTANRNEANNKEEEEESHNSGIERMERCSAAVETARWFVPRTGNMTQDRPEGVF